MPNVIVSPSTGNAKIRRPLSAAFCPTTEAAMAAEDVADGMDAQQWFELTLARSADDEEERTQFQSFMSIRRKSFKVRDVEGMKELSRTQLLMAAAEAVGEDGKRGLLRLVLKHLGTQGSHHVPPEPEVSEAMQTAMHVHRESIKFGRAGKTGMHSNEHNFPDAMRPSSKYADIKHGRDVQFPEELLTQLFEKADAYNEYRQMPQVVTMELASDVALWIVSSFGVSPVRRRTTVAAYGCSVAHTPRASACMRRVRAFPISGRPSGAPWTQSFHQRTGNQARPQPLG